MKNASKNLAPTQMSLEANLGHLLHMHVLLTTFSRARERVSHIPTYPGHFLLALAQVIAQPQPQHIGLLSFLSLVLLLHWLAALVAVQVVAGVQVFGTDPWPFVGLSDKSFPEAPLLGASPGRRPLGRF